jgi:hypothetical protein
MSRYEGKELSFEIPDGWQDRSIVAFSSPIAPDKVIGLNVVATRDELQAGDTLNAYATRVAAGLSQSYENLSILERKDRREGPLAIIELLFRFDGDNGPTFQHMAIVMGQPPRVWVLTGTAPESESREIKPVMEKVLATLRLGPAPFEARGAAPARSF